LRRRLRPVPGDGDPPRPERRGDGGAVPPGLGAGRGTGRGPDPGRGGGRRAAGGGGRRPRPEPPGRGRDGTHARAGPDRGRGGGGVHRLPRLGGLRGRGGRRGGPAPPAGRGHGHRGGPGHRPRTPVAQGVSRLRPGYGLVLGDVRPVPARPVRGRRRGRPGQRRRVPHRRGPGGRRGRSVAARRRATAVGRGRGRPAARNIRRGASMTYPRDLHGYGPNPPDPQWPGGARLAVQFVINYEEGGERSILHGDRTTESFLTEEPKPARPNIRDLAVESMFEYGSRAGFWRLYRLFTERNLPVTIFGVTEALERNPDAVAAMKEAGWEIASHGLRWIDYSEMPIEEERRHIREAVASHERVTGERPAGYYLGRMSANTRPLLVETGGFVYDADSFAD